MTRESKGHPCFSEACQSTPLQTIFDTQNRLRPIHNRYLTHWFQTFPSFKINYASDPKFFFLVFLLFCSLSHPISLSSYVFSLSFLDTYSSRTPSSGFSTKALRLSLSPPPLTSQRFGLQYFILAARTNQPFLPAADSVKELHQRTFISYRSIGLAVQTDI